MRLTKYKVGIFLAAAALLLAGGCSGTGVKSSSGAAAEFEEKEQATPKTPWKGTDVIMRLGDTTLSYTDMKSIYDELSSGEDRLDQLTRDRQEKFFTKYYYQKLFAKVGYEMGLEKTRNYLDHTRAVRYRLLEKAYKSVEIYQKLIPTDDFLFQFIPPAEDEVQVRVIVKSSMDEAQKVYKRAIDGEDFVKLCQETSEGFQRAEGGLSPWLSLHNSQKYPPPVVETFLQKPLGTVVEPFFMDIGFLIIKIVGKRGAEELRQAEFKSKKPLLIRAYQDNALEEKKKHLMENAKIVIHEDVVEAFSRRDGDRNAVIMEINSESFLASEVLEEMIDAGHGGQPVRQRVESFIPIAVFAQEALKVGVDKSDAFLSNWRPLAEVTLAREVTRKTAADADAEPVTDEELVAYVKANPDKYMTKESRQVFAIFANEKETAQKVIDLLHKGVEFGDLAKQYSTHKSSADKGGELGWAGKDELPTPFQGPVFQLDPGTFYPEPIEALSNEEKPIFIVVKVLGVEKPAPAPIERVNLRNAEQKVRAIRRSNSLEKLAKSSSAKYGYELCILAPRGN